MCRALVFLANGFEEVEAVTIIDILRRAGIKVITASIHDRLSIKGAHEIIINADELLSEISTSEDFDIIILPGGLPGADFLNESAEVEAWLIRQHDQKKMIAAICAAPKILCAKGIATNLKITHYPGCVDDLNGAKYVDEKVVHDGNLITSKGPSTALEFSLKLVEVLKNVSSSDDISKQVLITK